MPIKTPLGTKAIANETVFQVDLDLLASDLWHAKNSRRLTYREMSDDIKCHLQTLYKFMAGDRAIGNDLFSKMCHYLGKKPIDYKVQQGRMKGF